MAVSVISQTLRAALALAKELPNGTIEAAYVQAAHDSIGIGTFNVIVRNAALAALGTSVRNSRTVNTFGAQKAMVIGEQVSWTWTADGTPAWVSIHSVAGDELMRWDVGGGAQQVQITANIDQAIPVTSGAFSIYAPTLDSTPGASEFWALEPPTTVLRRPAETLDLLPYITPGSSPLMAYSALPNGVDVLPTSVVVASTATVDQTHALMLGPRDWGYRLKPDDSSGTPEQGGAVNQTGGTSWQYFNLGAGVEWQIPGGVWRNEANVAQAMSSAYEVTVTDTDTIKPVTFDVKWIVDRWKAYPEENWGILLVAPAYGMTIGTIQTGQPAVLTITYSSGAPSVLTVDVDCSINPTEISPTGWKPDPIYISYDAVNPTKALLWWDIQPSALAGTIVSATLTVTSVGQFASGGGVVRVCAMRVTDPQKPQGAPILTGKTLQWTGGAYSGSDPGILFATQFPGATPGNTPSWLSSLINVYHGNWLHARTMNQGEVVDGIQLPASSQYGLLCDFPEGADVDWPSGESMGIPINPYVIPFSASFPFAKASNNWAGVDEIYSHIRLIFGNSSRWSDAGKFPCGVHGKLDLVLAPVPQTNGNGGAPANNSGWSARHLASPTPHHFMNDMPVRGHGCYAYHQNQSTTYGDHWNTGIYPAGLMRPGRVYDIDMRVRINTPGVNDGIVQCWTNDYLVLDRQNVQWRPATVASFLQHPALPGSVYNLNIAAAWSAIEYGGTGTIPPGEGGYILQTDWVVSTFRVGRQA